MTRWQVHASLARMGIDVHWVDEAGTVLSSVLDPQMIFPSLLPTDERKFPLLTAIDPYGDTVFNRLQIPRFIEEWRVLSDRHLSVSDREFVTQIHELAQRCNGEVHTYLKFVGD
jgi:hypothetical protein